ncbi:winged helix-turn-helix transcriptional regulator [bacterium]|nr:winged helix-turn-helix transcriptional regulator [bacterium]
MSLDLIFKALGDSTRRKILRLLAEKDMTAGEIVSKFDLSWSTISHHLEVLKSSGLITSEKQGQYIIYSINTTVFQELILWILESIGKNKEDSDRDESPVQSK